MKTNQALIIRDDSRFQITFTGEALRIKEEALDLSAHIVRVTDGHENAGAVEAQRGVKTALKLVEDARKSAKEPILDFSRSIDAAAKEFAKDLADEDLRLARLVGDFQQLELAKVRAAEAARNKELMEIERRRQAEVAKATTIEQAQVATERANQEAQALPPTVQVRAEGQIVREDWQITVTDIWALARSHPMCVSVTPRLQEIRALLDSGIKVNGVSAVKAAKATVRTAPGKPLDIAATRSEVNRPPIGWPTD